MAGLDVVRLPADDLLLALAVVDDDSAREEHAPVRRLAAAVGEPFEHGRRVHPGRCELESDRHAAPVRKAAAVARCDLLLRQFVSSGARHV